jgi:hypothetical protein
MDHMADNGYSLIGISQPFDFFVCLMRMASAWPGPSNLESLTCLYRQPHIHIIVVTGCDIMVRYLG